MKPADINLPDPLTPPGCDLRGLPYIMRPIGLRIPKDGGLGSDVAGQVEAVVRRPQKGDGEGVVCFSQATGHLPHAVVVAQMLEVA